jgi:flagella basal body P-ring formation protein FlgA
MTRDVVMVTLFVCALSSSVTRAAIIELKDAAEVSTSVVRLGQVAKIHDADSAVVERLSAITLFPAPSTGKSKTIDFETIRERLAAQGVALSEIEFSGSSQVSVSGGRFDDSSGEGNSAGSELTQRRAEELVTSAVRQYLREKAPSLGTVQIELKLTPKQVAALSAALSARVEITGGNEPYSGEQPFRARFFDRQGRRTEFQVLCRVRPLPQVVVPAANLPKGHVVRADDLSLKQQPATANAANYLEQPGLVVGQETRRTLRAGEPISAIDVRGVPLVRRGDIVTVVARNQGIVVRTDARAMADGSLGQPIKLVSLDGRRELSALVSGYHEATVRPSSGDEAATQGNGTGVRLLTGDPNATRPVRANEDRAPRASRVKHAALNTSGDR